MIKIVKVLVIMLALGALLVPVLLLSCGVLPYRVFAVRTGSMTPTIPPKSAVIVREDHYRVGQVISYRSSNGTVTHRLVKQTVDGRLVTKGDANRTADPGTITRSNIIGGVVAAPKQLGYWLVYFKDPAGLASLFLAVICAWLLYSLPTDVARLRDERAVASALAPALTGVPVSPRKQACQGPTPRVGPHPEECVILRCSRCGMTFLTGDELRSHARDWNPKIAISAPVRPTDGSIGHQVPPSLWKSLA